MFIHMLPEISSFIETLLTPVTVKVLASHIRKFMVILISKALEPSSLMATEDFEKTIPNVSLISSHRKHDPFSELGKIKRNSSLSGSLQYNLRTSETLLSVMGNYIPSVIFMRDNQRQTDWKTPKIGTN